MSENIVKRIFHRITHAGAETGEKVAKGASQSGQLVRAAVTDVARHAEQDAVGAGQTVRRGLDDAGREVKKIVERRAPSAGPEQPK